MKRALYILCAGCNCKRSGKVIGFVLYVRMLTHKSFLGLLKSERIKGTRFFLIHRLLRCFSLFSLEAPRVCANCVKTKRWAFKQRFEVGACAVLGQGEPYLARWAYHVTIGENACWINALKILQRTQIRWSARPHVFLSVFHFTFSSRKPHRAPESLSFFSRQGVGVAENKNRAYCRVYMAQNYTSKRTRKRRKKRE
jgi:hypothetical protein